MRDRWKEVLFVMVGALVLGAIGALLVLAAGAVMRDMADGADDPPECDGKVMAPGDRCLQMSGFDLNSRSIPPDGIYAEMKARGEERARQLRGWARATGPAARSLMLATVGAGGIIALARALLPRLPPSRSGWRRKRWRSSR